MEHLRNFKSSNVKAAQYDPKARSMHVTFKGDQTYHYPHVAPETWTGLKKAKSKGSFIQGHVSTMYKGSRVKE